ncbi:23S rRNA Gm-2251 2'-O-methyltransferase [Sulfurivirga caldicuralii]|uniref:23S rRNA Gm-2251 2'-O-methyltransferase n=1 Tax=Sulfurivirga caldicuralii TaxID=364032 RepID=A0A1N6FIH7_9GAMM|nr:23S rRNA (guanosine(2251)-2'-O)-methyltransferase RlmB [Sulfurivirga caldicuralii]SIN95079.1 23S rRNA Gm-2251 2'-O-methyltransferase [Sulfurivirga caldicuralii]
MSDWVYGLHAVEKLLKQGGQGVCRLVMGRGRLNTRQQKLQQLAQKQGITVDFADRRFFERFEGVHQGVVAELAKSASPRFTETDLPELIGSVEQPLIVFLDEVQDPHNLGAILRTCDATGAQAIVIPKHQSVGVTPVVRKVASGAAETIPVIAVNNLARAMEAAKEAGLWLVGLAGETDTVLFQQDLTGPVGLVLGAEGKGLRRLTREQCDFICALPMVGSVESLNVSVAAGVALYETLRQRRYA